MQRRSDRWLLYVVAVIGLALFGGLTVAVSTSRELGLDARAFEISGHLREPWLADAARVVTTLGMIAFVGPAVVLGALALFSRREHVRATALVVGMAVTWVAVLIVKWLVGRARPAAPLVHTSGLSYPSGHAANSVGWVALAVALVVAIHTPRVRIAALAVASLLAIAVGATRIYLRAHYASDVLAGEALAVAIYALATVAAIAWSRPRHPRDGGPQPWARVSGEE